MNYEYYEGPVIPNRVRREEMSIGVRYADYRTNKSRGRKKQEFIPNFHYDWAREIIRIRGEWLVENPVGLTIDFLDGKNLTELAKKYVKDDYEISSRTGRRIIYHALELLASKGVFERGFLDGIDPDPFPKIGLNWNIEEKARRPKRNKNVRSAEKERGVEREVEREFERELVGV